MGCGCSVGTRGYSGSTGFTLIELLVSIGVIALLIGLIVPSLSKSRAQTTKVICASSARTLLSDAMSMPFARGERWPNVMDVPALRFPLPDVYYFETYYTGYLYDYLGQMGYWHGPYAAAGIFESEDEAKKVGRICPEADRATSGESEGKGLFNSYFYSIALVTDSTLWSENNPERRLRPQDFRRSVAFADVLFPSQKAAFVETLSWHGNRKAMWDSSMNGLNVGLADGSVGFFAQSAVVPGLQYSHPRRPSEPWTGWPEDSIVLPMIGTPDGYRGIDVRR